MKRIAQKFGLTLMLAAAFTVAAHVFQHCVSYSEDTLGDCRVCQSIMAASAHAAAPAEAELVFVRDAVPPATPSYHFSPAAPSQSRAPPSAFSA